MYPARKSYFCILLLILFPVFFRDTKRENMGNCAETWTDNVAESDRQKAWEHML